MYCTVTLFDIFSLRGRKRPSTRSPALPKALIELYTPLLEFLDETLFAPPPAPTSTTNDDQENGGSDDSDSFIDTLVSRIVDILCTSVPTNEGGEKEDPTVHMTLQAWLLHLVPLPREGEPIEPETIETIEGILKTCLIAGTQSLVFFLSFFSPFGRRTLELTNPTISDFSNSRSISLVDILLSRTAETLPRLSQKARPLLEILRTNQQQASSSFVSELLFQSLKVDSITD